MCIPPHAQPFGAQLLAKGGIAEKLGEASGNIRDIERVDAQGCVGRDLRNRGPVGDEARRAAGHGFERRQAESFVERRIDESARRSEERRQVGIIDSAEQARIRGQRRRVGAGEDMVRAAPTRDDQLKARLPALRPCLEQADDILARRKRADEYCKVFRQCELAAQSVDLGRRLREEAIMVDAERRDVDRIGGEAECFDQALLGEFGNGDDPAHPRQQEPPLIAVPAAEAGRIALRTIDRRNIVDGDDLVPHADRARARGAPQELTARLEGKRGLFPDMTEGPPHHLGRLDGPDGVGLSFEKFQRIALHPRERGAENANVANDHHFHRGRSPPCFDLRQIY